MRQIWIGTSGWDYPHWRGRFYPPELPVREWLGYYARAFPTVEINRTFYRLPTSDQFRNWAAQVAPFPEFRFAIKASRSITHLKKLIDTKESVARFLGAAQELGDHLGIVLYQLPPHWHANLSRLEQFLIELPLDVPAAFEFRDPSWFEPDTLRDLEHLFLPAGVTLAIGIGGAYPTPRSVPWIGPRRYLRFHAGDTGIGFTDAELGTWAERLTTSLREGEQSYVFFNNDAEGHAVTDAQRLREMLGNAAQ